MEEKKFIGYIPEKEQEYLMRLSESDSPYISDLSEDGKLKSEGEYTKHTFFVSYLCNLQHLVGIYSKTVDAFMDIDMELYPELYETQEKAFEVYKQFKEKNIKVVADYYKNKIPNKLYDVMYNYEVETTD